MKKILHIITGLGQGGAENMLLKLIKEQRGYSHHVISLTDDNYYFNDLQALGVDIHMLGLKGNPIKIFSLRKLIKSIEPDVAMCWMYHTFITSFLFSKKTKVIWNVRQALDDMAREKLFTKIIIKLSAFLSYKPDVITYNSMRSLLQHQNFGYKKSKSCFIPNGFDAKLFPKPKPKPKPSIVAPLKLVNVARFHPVKGHDLLLNAFEILILEYKLDVTLDLFGYNLTVSNLNLKKYPINVENKINVNGVCSDICNELTNYDLYVSSSYSEAFPNVIGESLFSGLAVVATDAGDSALIIDKHGIIVNSFCPRELAEAIVQSQRQIDLQSVSARIARRNYAIDKYSMVNVSKKFIELF